MYEKRRKNLPKCNQGKSVKSKEIERDIFLLAQAIRFNSPTERDKQLKYDRGDFLPKDHVRKWNKKIDDANAKIKKIEDVIDELNVDKKLGEISNQAFTNQLRKLEIRKEQHQETIKQFKQSLKNVQKELDSSKDYNLGERMVEYTFKSKKDQDLTRSTLNVIDRIEVLWDENKKNHLVKIQLSVNGFNEEYSKWFDEWGNIIKQDNTKHTINKSGNIGKIYFNTDKNYFTKDKLFNEFKDNFDRIFKSETPKKKI